MLQDPVSTFRNAASHELTNQYRLYRKQASDIVRSSLIQGAGTDAITKALSDALKPYRSRTVHSLETYLTTSYHRGIDRVISQISFEDRTVPVEAIITSEDDAMLRDIISRSQDDVSQLHATILTLFEKDLQKGEKNSVSVNRQIKELYERYNAVVMTSADMLARTDPGRAYNIAAFSRIQKHYPYKTWNGVDDVLTRASHRSLHGVSLPVDEMFQVPDLKIGSRAKPVDGCLMMYPGDLSDNPISYQSAGCRCYITGSFVKPAEK